MNIYITFSNTKFQVSDSFLINFFFDSEQMTEYIFQQQGCNP